jgi:hypothetical protein
MAAHDSIYLKIWHYFLQVSSYIYYLGGPTGENSPGATTLNYLCWPF